VILKGFNQSFFGIDCSGFVQLVYKIHGIFLPRESHQQAEIGEVLSFVEESKPGDLAFFENLEGQISHVGIMLEDQKIIHAFGKVRIDSLDSTGIFNKELNKHTHKLRFLRRVV
jgi:cell wall-associated NlpC family hydrolase